MSIKLKAALGLEDFTKIIFDNQKIDFSRERENKVEKSFSFLKKFQKGKVIYGVNTGFGPMAQYEIKESELNDLQYNLIRSHSTGVGNKIGNIYVKAIMLARLNSLLQGVSGVTPQTIKILQQFINKNVFPIIYEHGSVGASGDLVQLSHLALALIGEGEVNFKGREQKTKEILKKLKIKPLEIKSREGLALINGTSCMTGIGLVNLILAKKLIKLSTIASAMILEITNSFSNSFSQELNKVKKHEGQKTVSANLRKILKDSKQIKDRYKTSLQKKGEEFKEKVQEYYSLRCVPQVLGPVLDTIKYSEKVLINELNSANDNPIVSDRKGVFHGGNFHGDYVSLEMDKLKIAITKLSMLSERQLNFLLNSDLNEILPPFVNLGRLGINLGCQALQFTATSTTAENQTLSNPMYVHSIPNNKDNQDIVSMGTNSALITKKVIENAYEILAIEFITILQAIDYLNISKKMSTITKGEYEKMRKLVPKFVEDTPKYKEIKKVKDYLMKV